MPPGQHLAVAVPADEATRERTGEHRRQAGDAEDQAGDERVEFSTCCRYSVIRKIIAVSMEKT